MPKTKVLQTRHVLAVRNLAVTREYFVSVLGFDVDFSLDGWEFLSFDDLKLMIGECPGDMPAAETGSHSYFANVLVDDANVVYSTFRAKGAKFCADIEDKPWGLREFCVVTPDGHRIVFAEELGD
ncbi:MAG: VOC family protein [Woeseiaceae bacterium]|nr:VOC family protein [Woeseiaceae bacterium]